MSRKTIKKEAFIEGIGLHTGNAAKAVFHPAHGTGIRFTGPGFTRPIRALLSSVSGTVRGTTITDGIHFIHTVEHILCAASALDIDDLDIEITGEEPPIADGSAKPFADIIMQAGIQETAGEPDIRRITVPVEASFGDVTYRAVPVEKGFRVSLVYENPHPLVGRLHIEQDINPETFLAEIAPARTFGYDFELDMLRKAGLAKGGSLKNALVITNKEILADGGLRYPDELVRHKLLDFLGDMALSGWRPEGVFIEAVRCGHSGNVKFASLLEEKNSRQI